jgi:hypothetical protein
MSRKKYFSSNCMDKRPLLALPFILLLLIAHPTQAEIQAALDRTTIYDGDTVTLIIEAVGADQDADPDLAVLEKDFNIIGTSSSRQIQIINGRRSDKRQWRVELEPMQMGEIRIPAIAVGSASTSPLTLRVEEAPTAVADAGEQPLFLRLEIADADKNPFVQQQIRLKLQLFYRVPLVEGNFAHLQPQNAVVDRLGDDRRYQTTINNQSYQVIERHYALFPEKSGELLIPSVSFTGRVASATSQRSPFGQFDSMMDRFFKGNPFGERGKRIRVRSQPLTLEVRPRPQNYPGDYWLPSEKLVLEDSWAKGPPELRVGEPVTRTIAVKAKGLESSQLPDIEVADVEHVRIYPEQVAVENHTDGNWVFGTRIQNIAYVPSRLGPVSLPEIRINWWNTVSNKSETAVIPAWELQVLPATGSDHPATPPVQAAADGGVGETQPQTEPAGTAMTQQGPARSHWLRNHWPWLAAIVILVLAAAGLPTMQRRRRNRLSSATEVPNHAPAPATSKPVKTDNSKIRRTVQQACELNDAQASSRALLLWAESVWPDHPPRSLGSLAKRIDAGSEQVRQLERALYSPDHEQWNGSSLWQVFSEGLITKSTAEASTDSAGIAPLYPNWKHKQA